MNKPIEAGDIFCYKKQIYCILDKDSKYFNALMIDYMHNPTFSIIAFCHINEKIENLYLFTRL